MRVLDGAPADPGGEPRTRQADIQQTDALGPLLACIFLARGVVLAGEQLPDPRQAIMESRHRRHRAARAAAGGGRVGQEHQVECQALADMQGHDVHAPGVGFEAQQFRIVARIGIFDPPFQPGQQAAQAERAAVGGLQFLAQLQVVAEASLAIGPAEQARRLFGADLAEQGHRPVPARASLPGLEPILPGAMARQVDVERSDLRCVQPEQWRGEHGAHPAVVAWAEQGVQQPAQMCGLLGLVQAASTRGNAGNADV